jgi:hypothetical protein
MRHPKPRLALEQAEDRFLPSVPAPAPGPAIEHQRVSLPDGNRPREGEWLDAGANDGRLDWFVGGADRPDRVLPDHFRHGEDDRATRGGDGDDRLIGRPAPANPTPTQPAASVAPAHSPEHETGRRSGSASLVSAVPIGPAPAAGQSPVNVDRASYSNASAIDVAARPQAPAGEDERAAPAGELTDATPAGCPAGTPDEGTTAGDITRTVAVAVEPVAGLVPFDLGALVTGAGRILGAVSDLEAACAEELPAWDQSLWVGTALLLAAGAAHAAAARPGPRPPADPRNRVLTRQVVFNNS